MEYPCQGAALRDYKERTDLEVCSWDLMEHGSSRINADFELKTVFIRVDPCPIKEDAQGILSRS